MVLKRMKEIAEGYLGTTVTDAVVTVPAYFTNPQRLATKNACTKAGLNLLGMINEPTAAALAYGLEQKFQSQNNVLIFDLGGGTFDVTVLTIKNTIFEVKSINGDSHLGGEDFDNQLVSYVINSFYCQHEVDLWTNKRAVRKIRTQCEEAKRTLSSASETTVIVDSVINDIDLEIVVTRNCFEEICDNYFKLTLDFVKRALKDAKLDKSEVDEILLIGGSSRIPKIQTMLKDFFGGKNLAKSINPDEAVAQGAAIHAAFLAKDTSISLLQNLQLTEVTPFSLGVKVALNEMMSTIVKRNTTIPIEITNTYCTAHDYQTVAEFRVYEGEDRKAENNCLLGKFEISGIPPAPEGVEKFDVTFDIDNNGILNVTAVNESTSRQNSITIALNWK